ncbi:MAG: hypothetical protein COU29_02795 [Candidatus Magasanikbacteria bacterium CG10_big_fil_rev_8_21_14_0_10_36_32]|uniref:Uncharacterized protein n=1 Tax=Candidatus Magasanikbacteria bacterium CG10_big_fil_rev_8_21_14_0_10_36_32 TaxID=1974646 RepID=A0A2M6W7B6_9BACT|nr:MAG: hypothetical protein COU29_02795 [Candidatus Magasanikbacteria bacterium CG10_big_fil_rev_8_21_14_0_10_36_32]
MFNFVKNFLTKREGKNKYGKMLVDFLSDGKLDDREKEELKKLSKEYGLEAQELLSAHKKASSLTFKNIISDSKITEDERKSLEELMNYFGISQKDFDFDQKAFNKFYALGLIDKGIMLEIQQHDVDIIFKKGEVLHWGCPAVIKKYKRIANRINYGGLTGSIKIMKGLRYRVGSIGYSTASNEHLITEDVGIFWLTNQRVGFKGNRKNFSFPYSKIHVFELTQVGLLFSKEGKEIPYIVGLDDYDVPCMMISHILNNNKE